MSGHRPWSRIKRQAKATTPLPAPPPPPAEHLSWGPVTFAEAPVALLEALIRTLDEGRLLETDVERMLDWAQDSRRNGWTLTWTDIRT